VSRLSSRHVRLRLGPSGASAELRGGWFAPVRLGEANMAATDGPGDPEASAGSVLDALIGQSKPGVRPGGLPVDVELADVLAHFDVAEGDFRQSSDRELGVVARACALEVLGTGGPAPVLRWQLQRGGRHLLVCALPRPLADALNSALQTRGLRLRSLQPAFFARWNRQARLLAKGLAVFASCDGQRAAVAFAREGVVEAIDNDQGPAGSVAAEVDHGAPDSTDPVAPARLDVQVDRLVASLGVELDQISSFVACTEPMVSSCSPRWSVHPDPESRRRA